MNELLTDTLALLQLTLKEGGFPNPEISKQVVNLMERLDKKIYCSETSFFNDIENAWLAGYYHSGYTYDSTYALQESKKYFKSVHSKKILQN